ncbi:MAG: hypothetical protein BWY63_02847 [Chloroflexi bacterium ADurb.Bin360]|nr:MAG: hypothetical protein BWY63_02847 [Chloroflexi bacterium ADurb.Bin360]
MAHSHRCLFENAPETRFAGFERQFRGLALGDIHDAHQRERRFAGFNLQGLAHHARPTHQTIFANVALLDFERSARVFQAFLEIAPLRGPIFRVRDISGGELLEFCG